MRSIEDEGVPELVPVFLPNSKELGSKTISPSPMLLTVAVRRS